MRPLRIVHTESSMGWGGQEMRVILDAEGLSRRGRQVWIAAQPGSRILERAESVGLPVFALSMRRSYDIGAIRALRRFVKRNDIQILNSHSSKDAWIAGLTRLTVRSVRVVRTRHLSIPVKNDLGTRWLYHSLSDHIVTTGEALREQLIQENGLSPERVRSIPTGVDLDRFDPHRVVGCHLRAELGIDESARIVSVIAMLRRMKGHRVLVAAAPRIIAAIPAAHFMFVGDIPSDSPVRRQLEEQIHNLGLRERFHLVGYRTDIPELLAITDCLALPSVEYEGVPQAVTQALAMERPVVASDVGAVAEVVRDGVTGRLVPPGDADALADAIIALLSDRETAAAMGAAGREFIAAHYSVEAMLDRTEALYAELLGVDAR